MEHNKSKTVSLKYILMIVIEDSMLLIIIKISKRNKFLRVYFNCFIKPTKRGHLGKNSIKTKFLKYKSCDNKTQKFCILSFREKY